MTAVYLNRELSDLAFVARVLDQSMDQRNPPLERLNFLIITEMLLDEFYRIRITALRTLIRGADVSTGPDGLTARQNLAAINQVTNDILGRQDRCWASVKDALSERGVSVLMADELAAADIQWIVEFFESKLEKKIKPVISDSPEAFPDLRDGRTYLVCELATPEFEWRLGVIPLPTKVRRFFDILDDRQRFVTIETMMKVCLPRIFPDQEVVGFGLARVLREGNLHRLSDNDDLPSLVTEALEKRSRADVIRLNVTAGMPERLRRILYSGLQMDESRQELDFDGAGQSVVESEYVAVDGLIGLADARDLLKALRKKQRRGLVYDKMQPSDFAGRQLTNGGDIFKAIRQRDHLLHFPFDRFDAVTSFLRQAAEDPDVRSIRQTLYRVDRKSAVIDCLELAAQNGKDVTAVIELEARDDERNNLALAKRLEKAGARVSYGFLDKKVHAKIIEVTRRENGEDRHYLNLATGNYHEGNARAYTDLSLFTCDGAMGRDVTRLFGYVTTGEAPSEMEALAYAPHTLRQSISNLIAAEAAAASGGGAGTIWIKINKLTDIRLIDSLYDAARAGVDIEIIVRGICCLNPGHVDGPGKIRVTSLVGRFLEHSRVFCFGNGEPMKAKSASVYISSADWMPHKLDKRVELMVPLLDHQLKDVVINRIMRSYLDDRSMAWHLGRSGAWHREEPGGRLLYDQLILGGQDA